MRSSQGWREIDRERKREIIDAIAYGHATRGPSHAELDLTDRCNVACYFCNQQDTRTSQQVPIARALRLVDELAANGVRSVRLSGGGDPLFHREILEILDRLHARGVVIDNLTTNGVALTDEVACRLVEGRAREVIFSLNGADAADYHRMMRVKPALFEKVLANIRNLVARRGDEARPHVVAQFLIDRVNVGRLVEMYELAVGLGVDTVAINPILEIPLERIDHDVLLDETDRETARPLFAEILRRDREHGVLEVNFAIPGWNEMVAQVEAEVGHGIQRPFPTAPSFRELDGGCFFGWYTTVVTGSGNLHPCCLLMRPGREPLGNVLESSFAEQWNGPAYVAMRDEMREHLLEGSSSVWNPERFKILDRACVEPHVCWLKNMFFRGDEEFYAELGRALDAARRRRERIARLLARHPRLAPPLLRLLEWSRPLRRRASAWWSGASRPRRPEPIVPDPA